MNEQEKQMLSKLKEIVPHSGLIFSQLDTDKEILCKPKILPLKSLTLLKLEELEKTLLTQLKDKPKDE